MVNTLNHESTHLASSCITMKPTVSAQQIAALPKDVPSAPLPVNEHHLRYRPGGLPLAVALLLLVDLLILDDVFYRPKLGGLIPRRVDHQENMVLGERRFRCVLCVFSVSNGRTFL